jgi:hypothetical protein
MTDHQKARRARKSALFFAKLAARAAAANNVKEAARLVAAADAKQAARADLRAARTSPHFHHNLMAALDAATYHGARLTPAHSAVRRALREANMRGAAFGSAQELADAVAKFSPVRRAEILALAA